MTGDRTDPTTVDEPMGTTEPAWREEPGGTEAGRGSGDDDAERTIDHDPDSLTGNTAADLDDAGDSDRTIDVDTDVLEHVRAAVRAARHGLAAPPTSVATDGDLHPATPSPAATDDEPGVAAPAADVAPAAGVDLSLPPPPAGVPSSLPPATPPSTLPPPSGKPGLGAVAAAVAPDAATATPASEPAAAAMPAATATSSTAAPSARTPAAAGGRWQPPARLRSAEVRASAPLVADHAPARRHLDWRWAALGIVLAAVVGFLIAIAVSDGDDAPDPVPGSTTVPGASTIVSTP